MLPKKNITRRQLKGFFQLVDPEELDRDMPPALLLLGLEQEPKQAWAKERFDFEATILHYNKKSGLFIAKGKDVFGESGLVGAIKEEFSPTGPSEESTGHTISFRKMYRGLPINHRAMSRGNDKIFQGEFNLKSGVISCSGFYLAAELYDARKQSGDFEGLWKLESME